MAIIKFIILALIIAIILFIVIALIKVERMNKNIRARSKALQENIDKINKQLDEIEANNNLN